MDVIDLLLAFAVGALMAVLAVRSVYAARLAGLAAERDLLARRVADLEVARAQDEHAVALLAPVADALARVERQVGVLERDRVEQLGSVREALSRVESGTVELARTTDSLAGSLRSSTVRGSWGELQLRRVLESAGMLARCDFDEQVSAISRHEARVRPDVVVRLPGGKVLVVDAKAPMTAFLDAQVDTLPEPERVELLRAHARALTGHVRALAAKEYWSAFATSPELVVCFLPSDAMLAAALAADPSLHESALASRVVLVGPGSLLAVLRSVAFAWQQDALTDNARELLVLARELHTRMSSVGSHLAKMGRSLHGAVEGYNQLVGAVESRVLVTARKMSRLGVAGDVDTVQPLESTPRVLTAPELLDAVTAEDTRPQLVLDLAPADQRSVG